MLASDAPGKLYPSDMHVVEVQRTRTGKDAKTGAATRPYRSGEFDILAVSLQPSTKEWDRFMFTVSSWLLPRKTDESLIEIYQPVAIAPNDVWTDDYELVVSWLRSGDKKKIFVPTHKQRAPLPLSKKQRK